MADPPSFRRPFRAVPLRRNGKVIPFRKPRRRRAGGLGFPIFVGAASLAAVSAVFLFGLPVGNALPTSRPGGDQITAQFSRCDQGGNRSACVVDGDTIWLHSEKIRIADINTPEKSEPQCAAEAELAEQATDRLTELLNAGAFSLATIERDTDRYGRSLRVITRGGESLGGELVSEGLAEEWRGYRGNWC